MIEAYSTNLTATNGMTVPFNTKLIQTSYSSSLSSDGTSISLNLPGVYNVSFFGTATTTAAGDVGFQLFADGTAVPRTSVSNTTPEAGNTAAVSFNTNVKVSAAELPNKANLTVQYNGDAGTINVADIVVTRVR